VFTGVSGSGKSLVLGTIATEYFGGGLSSKP